MRLVNYGTGEITDRLTILALKTLHAPTVEQFLQEQTVLFTKLRGQTLNGAWFPKALELAALNAEVWHLEDAIRAFRKLAEPPLDAVKETAFEIQALNDRRAKLIDEINKLTGEYPGSTEKL